MRALLLGEGNDIPNKRADSKSPVHVKNSCCKTLFPYKQCISTFMCLSLQFHACQQVEEVEGLRNCEVQTSVKCFCKVFVLSRHCKRFPLAAFGWFALPPLSCGCEEGALPPKVDNDRVSICEVGTLLEMTEDF